MLATRHDVLWHFSPVHFVFFFLRFLFLVFVFPLMGLYTAMKISRKLLINQSSDPLSGGKKQKRVFSIFK
jgi:hypothetical protein